MLFIGFCQFRLQAFTSFTFALDFVDEIFDVACKLLLSRTVCENVLAALLIQLRHFLKLVFNRRKFLINR